MAHRVDGFGLEFTSRTSWKARRYERGREIDIIPVAWAKYWRRDPKSGDTLIDVYYRNIEEMAARRANSDPFVIALAARKDDQAQQPEFKEFRGVFEVQATGRSRDEHSLEAKVLRRLKAA